MFEANALRFKCYRLSVRTTDSSLNPYAHLTLIILVCQLSFRLGHPPLHLLWVLDRDANATLFVVMRLAVRHRQFRQVGPLGTRSR